MDINQKGKLKLFTILAVAIAFAFVLSAITVENTDASQSHSIVYKDPSGVNSDASIDYYGIASTEYNPVYWANTGDNHTYANWNAPSSNWNYILNGNGTISPDTSNTATKSYTVTYVDNQTVVTSTDSNEYKITVQNWPMSVEFKSTKKSTTQYFKIPSTTISNKSSNFSFVQTVDGYDIYSFTGTGGTVKVTFTVNEYSITPNKVFGGWLSYEDSEWNTVNPGDVTESSTLYAKWIEPDVFVVKDDSLYANNWPDGHKHVVDILTPYANPTNITGSEKIQAIDMVKNKGKYDTVIRGDSRQGSDMFGTIFHLSKEYTKNFCGHFMMDIGGYATSSDYLGFLPTGTYRSSDPANPIKLVFAGSGDNQSACQLGGNVIIDNVAISRGSGSGGAHGNSGESALFGNGHVLIMGVNITNPGLGTKLATQSTNYLAASKGAPQIFGGSCSGALITPISFEGNTEKKIVFGDGQEHDLQVNLGTYVIIHDGIYANIIAGSYKQDIGSGDDSIYLSTYLVLKGGTAIDTVAGGSSGDKATETIYGEASISGTYNYENTGGTFVYATGVFMPGDNWEDTQTNDNQQFKESVGGMIVTVTPIYVDSSNNVYVRVDDKAADYLLLGSDRYDPVKDHPDQYQKAGSDPVTISVKYRDTDNNLYERVDDGITYHLVKNDKSYYPVDNTHRNDYITVQSSIMEGGSSIGQSKTSVSKVLGSTHIFLSGTASVWDAQASGRTEYTYTDCAYMEITGKAIVRHVACGTITDGTDQTVECAHDVKIYVGDDAIVADVYGGGYDTWKNPTGKSMTHGSIKIEVAGGKVGNVFGGGFRGSIGNDGKNKDLTEKLTIDVVISGGEVVGNVYGGGSGGVDKAKHFTNGVTAGGWGTGYPNSTGYSYVYGDVTVTVKGNAKIDGDVYGGGMSVPFLKKYGNTTFNDFNYSNPNNVATVEGNITVNIEGNPSIKGSVYGGGKGISLTKNNNEYVLDGSYSTPVMNVVSRGAGHLEFKNIPWYTDSNGAALVSEYRELGTYYLEFAKITKDTEVHVSNSYDEDRDAPQSIYGGGAMGKVYGSTLVEVKNGYVTKNVFGGGLGIVGSTATYGDRSVYISGPLTYIGGSIYGGSSNGNDGVESTFVGSTGEGSDSLIVVDEGTIKGSIFGGGFMGETWGSAEICIGFYYDLKNDYYMHGHRIGDPQKTIEVDSIYGGGHISSGENDPVQEEQEPVLVHGNADIQIYGDGDLRPIYISGSVMGDGNSCKTAGKTSILMDGFHNLAYMNAIHRSKEVTLIQSAVQLSGRGTSSQGMASIYRVGTLILQYNSTISISSPIFDVNVYKSLTRDGTPTTSTAPSNSIIFTSGVTFTVTTDTQTMEGMIEGYTLITANSSSSYGAYIEGPKDSTGGFVVYKDGTYKATEFSISQTSRFWFISGTENKIVSMSLEGAKPYNPDVDTGSNTNPETINNVLVNRSLKTGTASVEIVKLLENTHLRYVGGSFTSVGTDYNGNDFKIVTPGMDGNNFPASNEYGLIIGIGDGSGTTLVPDVNPQTFKLPVNNGKDVGDVSLKSIYYGYYEQVGQEIKNSFDFYATTTTSGKYTLNLEFVGAPSNVTAYLGYITLNFQEVQVTQEGITMVANTVEIRVDLYTIAESSIGVDNKYTIKLRTEEQSDGLQEGIAQILFPAAEEFRMGTLYLQDIGTVNMNVGAEIIVAPSINPDNTSGWMNLGGSTILIDSNYRNHYYGDDSRSYLYYIEDENEVKYYPVLGSPTKFTTIDGNVTITIDAEPMSTYQDSHGSKYNRVIDGSTYYLQLQDSNEKYDPVGNDKYLNKNSITATPSAYKDGSNTIYDVVYTNTSFYLKVQGSTGTDADIYDPVEGDTFRNRADHSITITAKPSVYKDTNNILYNRINTGDTYYLQAANGDIYEPIGTTGDEFKKTITATPIGYKEIGGTKEYARKTNTKAIGTILGTEPTTITYTLKNFQYEEGKEQYFVLYLITVSSDGYSTITSEIKVIPEKKPLINVTFIDERDSNTSFVVTKTFPYGTELTDDLCPETGTNFVGWYTDIERSHLYNHSIPLTESVNLYSKYMYTVSFDNMRGTTYTAYIPQDSAGTKIPLSVVPKVNTTNDGYETVRWFTEPTYVNEWDFGTDTIDGNITLYAKWTGVEVDVLFFYKSGDQWVEYTGYELAGEKLKIRVDNSFNIVDPLNHLTVLESVRQSMITDHVIAANTFLRWQSYIGNNTNTTPIYINDSTILKTNMVVFDQQSTTISLYAFTYGIAIHVDMESNTDDASVIISDPSIISFPYDPGYTGTEPTYEDEYHIYYKVSDKGVYYIFDKDVKKQLGDSPNLYKDKYGNIWVKIGENNYEFVKDGKVDSIQYEEVSSESTFVNRTTWAVINAIPTSDPNVYKDSNDKLYDKHTYVNSFYLEAQDGNDVYDPVTVFKVKGSNNTVALKPYLFVDENGDSYEFVYGDSTYWLKDQNNHNYYAVEGSPNTYKDDNQVTITAYVDSYRDGADKVYDITTVQPFHIDYVPEIFDPAEGDQFRDRADSSIVITAKPSVYKDTDNNLYDRIDYENTFYLQVQGSTGTDADIYNHVEGDTFRNKANPSIVITAKPSVYKDTNDNLYDRIDDGNTFYIQINRALGSFDPLDGDVFVKRGGETRIIATPYLYRAGDTLYEVFNYGTDSFYIQNGSNKYDPIEYLDNVFRLRGGTTQITVIPYAYVDTDGNRYLRADDTSYSVVEFRYYEDDYGNRYYKKTAGFVCDYDNGYSDYYYLFSYTLPDASRTGYKLTSWHNVSVDESYSLHPRPGTERNVRLFLEVDNGVVNTTHTVREVLEITGGTSSTQVETHKWPSEEWPNPIPLDDLTHSYTITYEAEWDELKYDITVSNSTHGIIDAIVVKNGTGGNSRIRIDGTYQASYNDKIVLNYTSNDGYDMINWSIVGEYEIESVTSKSTNLIVKGNCSISVKEVGERSVMINIVYDGDTGKVVDKSELDRTYVYLKNKETNEYFLLEHAGHVDNAEVYKGYVPLAGDYVVCLEYRWGADITDNYTYVISANQKKTVELHPTLYSSGDKELTVIEMENGVHNIRLQRAVDKYTPTEVANQYTNGIETLTALPTSYVDENSNEYDKIDNGTSFYLKVRHSTNEDIYIFLPDPIQANTYYNKVDPSYTITATPLDYYCGNMHFFRVDSGNTYYLWIHCDDDKYYPTDVANKYSTKDDVPKTIINTIPSVYKGGNLLLNAIDYGEDTFHLWIQNSGNDPKNKYDPVSGTTNVFQNRVTGDYITATPVVYKDGNNILYNRFVDGTTFYLQRDMGNYEAVNDTTFRNKVSGEQIPANPKSYMIGQPTIDGYGRTYVLADNVDTHYYYLSLAAANTFYQENDKTKSINVVPYSYTGYDELGKLNGQTYSYHVDEVGAYYIRNTDDRYYPTGNANEFSNGTKTITADVLEGYPSVYKQLTQNTDGTYNLYDKFDEDNTFYLNIRHYPDGVSSGKYKDGNDRFYAQIVGFIDASPKEGETPVVYAIGMDSNNAAYLENNGIKYYPGQIDEYELLGDLEVTIDNDLKFTYYVISAYLDTVRKAGPNGHSSTLVSDRILLFGLSEDDKEYVHAITYDRYVGALDSKIFSKTESLIINNEYSELPAVNTTIAAGYKASYLREGFMYEGNFIFADVNNHDNTPKPGDSEPATVQFYLNWTRYDSPAEIYVRMQNNTYTVTYTGTYDGVTKSFTRELKFGDLINGKVDDKTVAEEFSSVEYFNTKLNVGSIYFSEDGKPTVVVRGIDRLDESTLSKISEPIIVSLTKNDQANIGFAYYAQNISKTGYVMENRAVIPFERVKEGQDVFMGSYRPIESPGFTVQETVSVDPTSVSYTPYIATWKTVYTRVDDQTGYHLTYHGVNYYPTGNENEYKDADDNIIIATPLTDLGSGTLLYEGNVNTKVLTVAITYHMAERLEDHPWMDPNVNLTFNTYGDRGSSGHIYIDPEFTDNVLSEEGWTKGEIGDIGVVWYVDDITVQKEVKLPSMSPYEKELITGWVVKDGSGRINYTGGSYYYVTDLTDVDKDIELTPVYPVHTVTVSFITTVGTLKVSDAKTYYRNTSGDTYYLMDMEGNRYDPVEGQENTYHKRGAPEEETVTVIPYVYANMTHTLTKMDQEDPIRLKDTNPLTYIDGDDVYTVYNYGTDDFFLKKDGVYYDPVEGHENTFKKRGTSEEITLTPVINTYTHVQENVYSKDGTEDIIVAMPYGDVYVYNKLFRTGLGDGSYYLIDTPGLDASGKKYDPIDGSGVMFVNEDDSDEIIRAIPTIYADLGEVFTKVEGIWALQDKDGNIYDHVEGTLYTFKKRGSDETIVVIPFGDVFVNLNLTLTEQRSTQVVRVGGSVLVPDVSETVVIEKGVEVLKFKGFNNGLRTIQTWNTIDGITEDMTFIADWDIAEFDFVYSYDSDKASVSWTSSDVEREDSQNTDRTVKLFYKSDITLTVVPKAGYEVDLGVGKTIARDKDGNPVDIGTPTIQNNTYVWNFFLTTDTYLEIDIKPESGKISFFVNGQLLDDDKLKDLVNLTDMDGNKLDSADIELHQKVRFQNYVGSDGWYTTISAPATHDPDYKLPVDEDGKYTFTVNESVSIYAETNSYTLYYHSLDGETQGYPSIIRDSGSTIDLSEYPCTFDQSKLDRAGSVFIGWGMKDESGYNTWKYNPSNDKISVDNRTPAIINLYPYYVTDGNTDPIGWDGEQHSSEIVKATGSDLKQNDVGMTVYYSYNELTHDNYLTEGSTYATSVSYSDVKDETHPNIVYYFITIGTTIEGDVIKNKFELGGQYSIDIVGIYTVYFMDGDVLLKSKTYSDNEVPIGIDAPTPEPRTGFVFKGWYYNDVPYDKNKTILDYVGEALSVTFTSEWLRDTTVNFYDGGTEPMETRVYHDNEPLGELPVPEPRGRYQFIGWFIDPDDPTTEITAATMTYDLDAVTNVYSKWGDITTVIVFHNGELTETRTYTGDVALGPLPDPGTREGYTFIGWFLESGFELTPQTKAINLEDENDAYSLWQKNSGPVGPTDPTERTWEKIVNPDGSVTTRITETLELPDGSVKVKVIETTNYDDKSIRTVTETFTDAKGNTDTKFDEKITYRDGYLQRVIEIKGENGKLVVEVPALDPLNIYDAKEELDKMAYDSVVFKGSNTEDFTIPELSVTILADNEYGLEFGNLDFDVVFDYNVVKHLNDLGGDVTLIIHRAHQEDLTEAQKSVIGDKYAITIRLTAGEQQVSELGGTATISVFYNGNYIYYVGDDGKLEEIPCEYDMFTGNITFSVEHFSVYMATKQKVPGPDPGHVDEYSLVIILAIAVLIATIIAVSVIMLRRKG